MKKEKNKGEKRERKIFSPAPAVVRPASLSSAFSAPASIPSSPPQHKDLFDSVRGWSKSFLKQFLIFSAIFLLLGLIVFFLSPSFLPRPSWAWSLSEEPLAKNSYLNISPGEKLVYVLSTGGQNQTLVIQAFSSSSCPGVVLMDMNARSASLGQTGAAPSISGPLTIAAPGADPSFYSVCLGLDGVERAADGGRLGSNISFSNLSWPYFQPWMLALSDDFNWSANATLSIQPFNLTQVTAYRYWVSARTVFSGRDAFEVHVYTKTLLAGSSLPPLPAQQVNGELPLRLLVDSSERVLLRAEFSDSTLTLADAPFLQNNGAK